IIEVKIAIKITRTSEYGSNTRSTSQNTSKSSNHKLSFWSGKYGSNNSTQVNTSQVDASYSSKYSYSAEGASILRTKLTPIPPPPMLEQRIRDLAENEVARRQAALDKTT